MPLFLLHSLTIFSNVQLNDKGGKPSCLTPALSSPINFILEYISVSAIIMLEIVQK